MKSIRDETLEEQRQRHVFMATWQWQHSCVELELADSSCLSIGFLMLLGISWLHFLLQTKEIPKDEKQLGNPQGLLSRNASS